MSKAIRVTPLKLLFTMLLASSMVVAVPAIGSAVETGPQHNKTWSHTEGGHTGGTCVFLGRHEQSGSQEFAHTNNSSGCWSIKARVKYCPTVCYWSAWKTLNGCCWVSISRDGPTSPNSRHQGCRNYCSSTKTN